MVGGRFHYAHNAPEGGADTVAIILKAITFGNRYQLAGGIEFDFGSRGYWNLFLERIKSTLSALALLMDNMILSMGIVVPTAVC